MSNYRHLFIISALCFQGCSSLSPEGSIAESQRRIDFLSWLVEDSIEQQEERIGGYSHSLMNETSGFPFPSHMDLESSYLAIVEGAERKGSDFSEAAEDYWEKNLNPNNVELFLEVPMDCLLVRKAPGLGIQSPSPPKYGAISIEQWEAGPSGYLYTVSQPGFSLSGEMAVVYLGIRSSVLGGAWGEMRVYELAEGAWIESKIPIECSWGSCGLGSSAGS